MPWTATFAANFEPFDQQLDRASTSLGQFEQDTRKVERSLQKMVSDFDGTKLSQQAQSMAASVQKIGGATKLTEAEQKKLNATVTEAMAKYRALGVDAPSSVQKLSRELQDAAARTRAVGDAAQKTGGILGSVKGIAAGMFAGFSAVAVVQGLTRIAGNAIATAGLLKDLEAQTGISAEALDKLRIAAEDNGAALTDVTEAIADMSKKLIGGDQAAVAAVNRLGLNFKALREQKPEDAFLTLVDAIGKIHDPMERTKVAFDTFGGKAKEVLRLTGGEFVEMARTINGASQSQIEQLDAAGKAWERLGRDIENTTGKFVAWLYAQNQRQNDYWSGAEDLVARKIAPKWQVDQQLFGGSVDPALGGQETIQGVTDFTETLKAYDDAARKAAEATSLLLSQRGWDAHVAQLRAASAEYQQMAVWSGAAAQGLATLYRAMPLPDVPGVVDGLPSSLTGYPNQVATPGVNSPRVFPASPAGNPRPYQSAWGGILSQVPGQLAGVFAGGGNIGAGLGSVGGGILGSLGGNFAGALGKNLSGMIGKGLSTTLSVAGNVLPIVGPLLGGILGKAIGGLFGPSKGAIENREATARIDQSKSGLLAQYGSLDAISKMGPAGNALAAAWGSQGKQGEQWFNQLAAEFTAQIQKQNQYLSEQQGLLADRNQLEADHAALAASLIPTWDTVSQLLDKYGISLEGAGAKVKQLATTSTFSTMINEMDTMERASIEVGHMLSGMADEISAAVNESIKFGTEIPANMKKYIQSLIDSGELLDENGEKITDITKIKFGAAIETEAEKTRKQMEIIEAAMSKVVDRLAEIADYLSRVIPAAAGTAANAVDNATRGAETDGGNRDGDDPTYSPNAAGGVYHRPRRALIGEGGQPEIVGPVDFMASALYRAMARADVGGVGGGAQVIDNRLELDGVVLGRQMITILPQAARRAGVRLPR